MCVSDTCRQDDVANLAGCTLVLESVYLAFLAQVKALSVDWEERHQRLKIEQEKVVELEAQIKLLNTKQEDALASLQADVLHAAAQIQEKEGLAEQLRAEVASLEERVRVACQEAAESAAELEKGAHEARLALEATLQQLGREDVRESSQAGHETHPPHLCEHFLHGQDTEQPGQAEGAEAAAEEALRGQTQRADGGLQEEVSSARRDLAQLGGPLARRWLGLEVETSAEDAGAGVYPVV